MDKNIVMNGYISVHDNFSKIEFGFWKQFFDYIDFNQMQNLQEFIIQYRYNISDIVYDYEKIISFPHTSTILNNSSFIDFCSNLNSIIPNATYSQHFLLFLLINDIENWQLKLYNKFHSNIDINLLEEQHVLPHFIVSPDIQNGQHYNLSHQVSAISALIEYGIMKKIYPQLYFLKNHTIKGSLEASVESLEDNRNIYLTPTKIIKKVYAPVEAYNYDTLSKAFKLDFKYSHLSYDEHYMNILVNHHNIINNNHKSVLTNYHKHQKYLINFIEHISLNKEMTK